MGKRLSHQHNSINQRANGLWQTIQAQFHNPQLKQKAKVAKIKIKNGQDSKIYVYPLLSDRYIIGRNRKKCDIVIANEIISQVHLAIERDQKRPDLFVARDLDSTNGVYLGNKRYKSLPLKHNDIITLGPPELANAIEIRFDNSPPRWLLWCRYSLFATTAGLLLLMGWIGSQWSKYQVYPLPDGVAGSTVVTAEDGKTLLAPRISSTHRELKRLKDFSPYLPKAVIASEDSRFYWHLGVDPLGVLRAITINYQADGIQQGASTLTQQLARTLFSSVGRENTLGRKIREMLVSLKIESCYSKNEILKTYLNRVYLGINLHGFEDAAQFYFNKSAKDLNLTETATLVAILPAPNAYNPVQDYDTAISLRNRVIDRMFSLGMINRDEAQRARRSRIEISPEARETLSNVIAPYFYSYVFQEMKRLLGDELAKEGDFIVETALNPHSQTLAETSLTDYLNTVGKEFNFEQGALVTIDTETGEIIALVGGKDFRQSQFNRATQAQRQPGSTFKVFAYAAGLQQGISPSKSYSCSALTWQGVYFEPCREIIGSTNLYQGIALSENPIALRVAQDVGLNAVIAMARNLGINSRLAPVPGLVLGQSEVNLLEMTGAYASFANQGIWLKPHAIRVIRDGRDCQDYSHQKTCREIYRFNQGGYEKKQAVSPELAQTMTKMLQGVIEVGTGRGAYLGRGEAGKTGTTNNAVDLWFIGYLPQEKLATGIWLGNDDNSPTEGSGSLAAVLWGNYLKKLL
jgi:1A family penicillin-binding protein